MQSLHWIYIESVERVFLRVIAGGGLPHQTVLLQVSGLLTSGVSSPAATCATSVAVGSAGVFARFLSFNLKSLHQERLAGGQYTRHGEAVPVAGR